MEKLRAVVSSASISKGGFLEEEVLFELGLEGVYKVWIGLKVELFIH